MALIDDVDVQWPNAVLPGSPSAQVLFAAYRLREKQDDERREREKPGTERYGSDS